MNPSINTKLFVSNIESLQLITEEYTVSFIKQKQPLPSLKQICDHLGLSISDIRRLSKKPNSNDYSTALQALGMPINAILLLNPRKRNKHILESGIAKTLILKLAVKLRKKPEELLQKDLESDFVIAALMPTMLLNTSELLLKSQCVSTFAVLKNWPNNWVENPHAHDLFQKLKHELCINSKWPSVETIRMNFVGRKFMDKFKNDVTAMCNYFKESNFETHAAKQHMFQDPYFIKQLIEGAIKTMGISLAELPNIYLKDLLEYSQYNNTLTSALSKNFSLSYSVFCCKYFPEMNFKPWHFKDGVPNKYWKSENGKLNINRIREAINEMVFKIWGRESSKSLGIKLGQLRQCDFNNHKLGSLASMPDCGMMNLIRDAFPEYIIHFQYFNNQSRNSCRLFHLLENFCISKDQKLEDCIEQDFCIGLSGNKKLVTDVVIRCKINGEEKDIFWEVQGPQHIEESHYFHKKLNKDSFNKQVQNDKIKFFEHIKADNIIIYIKPDQLSITQVRDEANKQGLDLENNLYEPLPKESLKKHLIEQMLLSPLVFE